MVQGSVRWSVLLHMFMDYINDLLYIKPFKLRALTFN